MQRPFNILVAESDGFSSDALTILRRLGDVRLADLQTPKLRAAVSDCDLLWVRLRSYIGQDILESAPHLKGVASPTTGLNHLDLALLAERGVRVFSLRGETDFLNEIRATAEHTLALMLGLLRNLPAASHAVLKGEWDRDAHQGRELYQKTVGIVGYGRLGKRVAAYCQALGCQVLATDPRYGAESPDPFVEMLPLEALLQRSQIVSLHASYSLDNEKFFGAKQFRLMPPGSWFINTARGELVDEAALLAALRDGRLAGAALDVLADEQLGAGKNRPLVEFAQGHRNLMITPHIGGCTVESMSKTEIFLAQKLVDAFSASAVMAEPKTAAEVGAR